MNNLEQLLYHCHIGAEYYSYSGEHIELPLELRLQFLQAMGYNAEDEQAVAQAIYQLDAEPWKQWLAAVNVVSKGRNEAVEIRIAESDQALRFNWQIEYEQPVAGESGSKGVFVPNTLAEVGEYYIDGNRYIAYRLPLADLPLGYHQIQLSHQQSSTAPLNAQAKLIVAPAQCYESDVTNQKQILGISCQLYTLRSARNWGIGDFTDLAELIRLSATAGVDMICLNPLHAPHLAAADFASPYSPSDRRFLNPLYIDIEAVEGFSNSKNITALTKVASFQQKMAALRDSELVDYDGVAEIKYWVFEALFNDFVANDLANYSAAARGFLQFVEQQGEALARFCEIESGQSVAGLAGAAFATGLKAAKEPLFHQYLQWLASEQLSRCQQQAIDAGMRIGLMGDLAVGAVSDGAEVTAKPNLFCTQASIGAPPDPFSDKGQNWNLPPLNPIALHNDHYRHFIELIRANMQYCGALRIDHVMGLLRLWWCLPNNAGGAYIYYPLETLMAIIRLESHRNRCLVVGEDMGVVPDEIRSCMHSSGMYSNKVFYFERDHQQQFADPVSHPSDALLMVTNHDVSTLAGWWETSDLQLRCETGNINQQELARQLQERSEDKRRLLQWLNERHSLPAAWCEALAAGQGLNAEVLNKPFDLALCGAILAVCARSAARLMSFQFEDLQLLTTPVNIPGTYREYPNWRRKQQQQTSALFANPDITAVLSIMVKQRQGKNIDLYQALQSINVAKDAAKNTATNVSTVRATTNYK